MKLVYDIGGYDGSDSAHYVSLGYKVICVEASPVMADKIRARHNDYIANGLLTVLNIGVGTENGTLPFFVSQNPLWSSFDEGMASRAGKPEILDIQMRSLSDLIYDCGKPYFVKIDVEGRDFDCLKSLFTSASAGNEWSSPPYLSCEADKINGDEMLFMLVRMGYTKFNLVRQDTYQHIQIPAAGLFSHTAWSARQLLRQKLRKRRWLHKILVKAKNSRTTVNPSISHGAGPPPMAHTGSWHSPADFIRLWRDVVQSGMIDSTWYDVHVTK